MKIMCITKTIHDFHVNLFRSLFLIMLRQLAVSGIKRISLKSISSIRFSLTVGLYVIVCV